MKKKAEAVKNQKEELEGMFNKFSKEQDPLTELSKMICPQLIGDLWVLIRKVVLLSMVTHEDVSERTRIHVLLNGPPGTGKTILLRWIENNLEGIMITGEHVSKVGLVGSAGGKDIQPGLLVDFHKSVVIIDEIEKLPSKDQEGLLQAMEEGRYRIVKKGLNREFVSEVRTIGASNDMMKLIRPLRDRFDFVFNIENIKRKKRADNVDKIIKTFFGDRGLDSSALLRKYIEWVRDFQPEIEENSFVPIVEMMREYIKTTPTKIDNVSIRNLEMSMLRIAFAMAKIEKNHVKPEHVRKAILLKNAMLKKLVGEIEE